MYCSKAKDFIRVVLQRTVTIDIFLLVVIL